MKKLPEKSLIALLFVLTTGAQTHALPVHQIQTRLQALVQRHRVPIAVLDLDETLIHSAQRKTTCYLSALKEHPTELAAWPALTRLAYESFSHSGQRLIRSLPNQYDSKTLFQRMSIQDASFIKAVDGFMIQCYLSGRYIEQDTAYAGAKSFLDLIYRAGGKIYFVTSRYQDVQFEPTLANLKHLGIFKDGASQLVLRARNESSLEFKKRAFNQIQNSLQPREEVFVVAENEAENLNAMIDAFPKAVPIYVMGATLNTSVTLNPNAPILKTRDFKESQTVFEQ